MRVNKLLLQLLLCHIYFVLLVFSSSLTRMYTVNSASSKWIIGADYGLVQKCKFAWGNKILPTVNVFFNNLLFFFYNFVYCSLMQICILCETIICAVRANDPLT